MPSCAQTCPAPYNGVRTLQCTCRLAMGPGIETYTKSLKTCTEGYPAAFKTPYALFRFMTAPSG